MDKIRYPSIGNYTSALLPLARLMLVCLYMTPGVPRSLLFTDTIDKMVFLGFIFPAITAAIMVLAEVAGVLMIVFGFLTRPVSTILCLYTVSVSFPEYAFWMMPTEPVYGNMIHFYRSIRTPDGFLVLIVPGPGRIFVDRR